MTNLTKDWPDDLCPNCLNVKSVVVTKPDKRDPREEIGFWIPCPACVHLHPVPQKRAA